MYGLKSSKHIAPLSLLKMLALCIIFLAILDFGAQNAARAETLMWDARPATNFMTGGSDVATINGVTITTSGTRAGSFDSAGLNQHEIQPAASINGYTGFAFSIFNATADNESSSQTTTLSFSEPVYNVSFLVGDIDGGITYNDGTNSFTDIIEFRANAGSVLPTSGTPVDPARVSWNSTTGRATATSNVNLADATGSITVTFAGPITSLTIRHIAGDTALANPTQQGILIDDVSFRRSPRLTLQKTSVGSVATFNYSVTNGPSGTFTTSVTTTNAGTPASGSQNRLGTVNTASTVTETGPSGWLLSSSISCTDANSANSGNPSSFTTTASSNAFTIPATNIRAGADLTCAMTNTKLPTLQLRKTSNGGTHSFGFSATNGFGSATITTTVSGTPTSITARDLENFSTATVITETPHIDYNLTGISCTGIGSGTATPNLAAGTITLDTSATAPGNNIVCTFTNDRAFPVLTIMKFANTPGPVNVDDMITYTYRIANTGNTMINNINISEAFNGMGSAPVPLNEILTTDSAPSGDSTDTVNSNGIWSKLAPGDTVTFTANYTVVQNDIDMLQ